MFERLVERAGGQEEDVGRVEELVILPVNRSTCREDLVSGEGRWPRICMLTVFRISLQCIPQTFQGRFYSVFLTKTYMDVAWDEHIVHNLSPDLCRQRRVGYSRWESIGRRGRGKFLQPARYPDVLQHALSSALVFKLHILVGRPHDAMDLASLQINVAVIVCALSTSIEGVES